MNKKPIVLKIEQSQIKDNIPHFQVGDTVAVHTRIIEGQKERIQIFQGTVIARKGSGAAETFSLHRVAYGEGMERVFQLHSPRIAEIKVVKEGDVRRSKLYNLRGTFGKKAKVKGRIRARVNPTTSTNNSVPHPVAEEASIEAQSGEEAEVVATPNESTTSEA